MYMIFDRIEKITKELKSQTYPEILSINGYKIKKGRFQGGENPEPNGDGWQDFSREGAWCDKNSHYWFKTKVVIPHAFQGKTVLYRLETEKEEQWSITNPQFLLYVNGDIVQGLDTNHREAEIAEAAVAGDTYTIALHIYTGKVDTPLWFSSNLVVLDRKIEKLYYDMKVPLDVAALMDKDDIRRIDILNYLNNAVNMLNLRVPYSESYFASVREANEYLENEFYNDYCGADEITTHCIGHTHIDVAWLWTLAHTHEKTVRSFSTVLNLMKSYPEYRFMASQPQLYQFIKQDQPEVYEEVKKRVKEGRWEPEGSMWLESDCNLTSGESLVRQILFGKRFFEREFGVDNRILWIPDAFGFNAALPQIMKKSGIDFFVTSKISWSEYNKLPYDTFTWKGIDGTGILTHFITNPRKNANHPHNTYNGSLNPSDVLGTWQQYKQKDLNREVILTYGYGDGGGGPTKDMLENARRLEKGIPGCPKVRLGSVRDFFNNIEKAVKNNNKLPQWVGELYLEYHRGTYTSMARNKKYNRKSEFLLQDTEWLSVLNGATGGNMLYPADKINCCWETVLLNQFHDILPGSSIKEVYDDSRVQYEEVLKTGRHILRETLAQIASKVNLNSDSILVFNQLGFERNDVAEVELPEAYEKAELVDTDGKSVPFQYAENGKIIFLAENIPAKGYKAYKVNKTEKTGVRNQKTALEDGTVSNRFFTVHFDESYNIESLVDKRNGREIIREGCRANVLQAFEDKPIRNDAWDINLYYQEKMWEINRVSNAVVVEDGPVRTAIRVEKAFLDSSIVQTIVVNHVIPRIDFHNTITWNEKHILLKAAFPVDIHSEKATYDIQYGNIERPTHWNTSWDYARFEVCGHKWADVSENDYGVSLMNDCKYGYDIKDGVMRLSLLKSATHPNEDADREVHEFTYSLYPHCGDWRDGGTVQMAYSLNCPLYTRLEEAHEGNLPEIYSLIGINRENVIIEVVKQAEDHNGIIVRMYECYNRRTKATATFCSKLLEVWECDLMENKLENIPVSAKCFEFEIRPYEIKTFKVQRMEEVQ